MKANKKTMNPNDFIERVANNVPNTNRLIEENKTQHRASHEQMSECIDNSFSDFEKNGIGNTVIVNIVEGQDETVEFTVTDNGSGIADLDAACTYANTDHAQTAKNAHGFGPWQIDAIDATVYTTHNGKSSFVSAPFVVNVKIHTSKKVFEDLPHGTKWEFTIRREYLSNEICRVGEDHGAAPTNDFLLLCEYFAENIGFRFSKDLLEHPEYRILVVAQSKDNTVKTINVEPLYPVFQTLTTTHGVIPQYTAGTESFSSYHTKGKFTIDYQVGLAEPNRPSLLKYFAPCQSSQCFYIALANRIITRTDGLSDVKAKHNDFNGMMGVVYIHAETAQDAPQTLPSKNHFKEADFTKLKKTIFGLVPGLTHTLKQYKGKETFHSILRDRLAENLSASGNRVLTEYTVDDVTAETMDAINFTKRCAYELKTGTAGISDVNQVYGYVECLLANASPLVPCPVDTVYLAAQKFVDGVSTKVDRYNASLEKAGANVRIVPILLADMEEINYKEERKKFYAKSKK